MKTHSVLVLEPGDRFVTEQVSQVCIAGEPVEIRTNIQYWKIDVEGRPTLINPPPEDVSAYLLGDS